MKYHIFIFVVLILFFSCNNTPDWDETQNVGTLKAYREFLKNNPESEFVSKARLLIDSIENNLWDSVSLSNNKIAYKQYLKRFPEGKYIDKASKVLDSLKLAEVVENEWEKCLAKNDTSYYKEFIKKYTDNLYSLKAEKQIFLIKNPKFNNEYKKILDFFEKIGNNDFSNISSYFAYKTIFEKNTFEEESVKLDENGDTLSQEVLDSIRLAASEPKTPPYTQKQLYEFGFNNISNLIIYRTFLNKILNVDGHENICKFTIKPTYVEIDIEYWDNGSKGSFSLTWINENNEWCISKFINNLPR